MNFKRFNQFSNISLAKYSRSIQSSLRAWAKKLFKFGKPIPLKRSICSIVGTKKWSLVLLIVAALTTPPVSKAACDQYQYSSDTTCSQQIQEINSALSVLFNSNPDSCLSVIDHHLSDPSRLTHKEALLFLMNKARVLRISAKLTLAVNLMLDAKKMMACYGSDYMKGNLANLIGLSYERIGSIEEAIQYIEEALYFASENNDTLLKAQSLANLANVIELVGDHNKSIAYSKEALSLAILLKSTMGEIILTSNIGASYLNIKQYDSSIVYCHRALLLSTKADDKFGIATALNNLGLNLDGLMQFDSALVCLNKGLDLQRELGDKRGEYASLTGLANIHQKQYGLTLLKNIVTEMYDLSLTTTVRTHRRSACEWKEYISKEEENYKEALFFRRLKETYNDSIISKDHSQMLGKIEMRYEMHQNQLKVKYDMEAQLAEAYAEESRRNNLQYLVILVIILLIFGSIAGFGLLNLSPQVAEGLIFFSFLILFEFVLVLADPYVENWSKGAPGYKLLFNAVLAGVIFPLHAFFERVLKVRLLKNRRK